MNHESHPPHRHLPPDTQDKGDEIGLSDYFELSAKTGSDEQIAAPFLRLVTLLED
jgi:hypothetical protein